MAGHIQTCLELVCRPRQVQHPAPNTTGKVDYMHNTNSLAIPGGLCRPSELGRPTPSDMAKVAMLGCRNLC